MLRFGCVHFRFSLRFKCLWFNIVAFLMMMQLYVLSSAQLKDFYFVCTDTKCILQTKKGFLISLSSSFVLRIIQLFYVFCFAFNRFSWLDREKKADRRWENGKRGNVEHSMIAFVRLRCSSSSTSVSHSTNSETWTENDVVWSQLQWTE